MNQAQNMKVEVVLAGGTATLATNASNYGYIDTLGWDHCKLIALTNAFATTSATFNLLSVTEGTNSTAASAIVALTGGTATSTSVGFVIPAYKGATEGSAVIMDIDLRKRERYLRVQANVGNADTVFVLALLSRGEIVPGSDDGSAVAHVIA